MELDSIIVGPDQGCDYITNGTDDHIKIQQALDAAINAKGVVIMQPADYNFGDSGYINVPNGIN